MECEDVRERLKAFIDNDLEDSERSAVRAHLDSCRDCSRAAGRLARLGEALQAWKAADPPEGLYDRLKARLGLREPWWRRALTPAFAGKAAIRFAEAAAIVLVTLAVSGRIRTPRPAPQDDEYATINLYMTEHREAVLQTASVGSFDRQPDRIVVNRDNIMYYEYIDGERGISRPGVILRGPESGGEAEAAAPGSDLLKAKTLTLPQAQAAVSFGPVAPSRVHPGYILDTITKVAGRESLHLLYTNGIDSFSVFEQPLAGGQGLATEDFRKYAVYQSSKPAEGLENQAGMTILAWKNTHVSFVLIGRADMSRLMDIAQAFTDAGKGMNEFRD